MDTNLWAQRHFKYSICSNHSSTSSTLTAALSPKEKGPRTAEFRGIWKPPQPLCTISEVLCRLPDFPKQLFTSPLPWQKENHQNYKFHITLKAGNRRPSSHTSRPLCDTEGTRTALRALWKPPMSPGGSHTPTWSPPHNHTPPHELRARDEGRIEMKDKDLQLWEQDKASPMN